MKGLLIIPKKPGDESPMKEEEDDSKFSDKEFNDLFEAFCGSLGVAPDDSGKAAKRLKSLITMICSQYE